MGSSSFSICSSQSDDSDDFEIVERDPTGQYVRYDDVLGEGALKTVYKAFDEVNGNEVAWSIVEISEEILNSKKQLERLHSEASLLKSLKHENVIRCHHSWVDSNKKTFNMITELFTSGNLRQYRKKHGLLDNKAIKNWARQILRGLDYLHSHSPPIVHRDLKCENIFVNGNSGKVKIGNLGLATVLQHKTAQSVIGTPEFMAPELYEEEYDQLVDIYSFGMCMLQMVTRELPYSECQNSAQVYKKVISGIKPAALNKVTEPQVKQFIEKCLAPASERLSAIDLLNHPFLAMDNSGQSSCIPSLTESVCSSVCSSVSASSATVELVKAIVTEMNVFKLQGQRKDRDSVSMTLWISDLKGTADKVDFVFSLQTDTALSITQEMVEELNAEDEKPSTKDAAFIADLMEELITELVPDFNGTPEAKGSSQKSLSSVDDLNLQNETANEELYSPEALPPDLGEDDPLQQPELVDLSRTDPDSSNYDNMNTAIDNMRGQCGSDSQFNHSEHMLDSARKPDKKHHKLLRSCLKKLLFHCGNKF